MQQILPNVIVNKKLAFAPETVCNRDSAYGPFIGNASPLLSSPRIQYKALRRSASSFPAVLPEKKYDMGDKRGLDAVARPTTHLLPRGTQGRFPRNGVKFAKFLTFSNLLGPSPFGLG